MRTEGCVLASLGLLASAGLSACAARSAPPPASEPLADATPEVPPSRRPAALRPVDGPRIFSGRWRAFGRLPAGSGGGCALLSIEFRTAADGDLFERDVCRPRRGGLKETEGRLTIENPGLETRYLVRVQVMGAFYVPRNYVILDHGGQYQWFIRSEAASQELTVFTREPKPSSMMTDRIAGALISLGVDPKKLERLAPS